MDTSTILCQRTMPWANEKLGDSKYYIHAYGGALTCLAEILGTTPDIVNGTLKAVNGFSTDQTGELDQIIWEKIVPAFPGWSAQFFTPYNNDIILQALGGAGRGVIVFVDAPDVVAGQLHAVRYIGGGQCHDPFTGTQRPTSDFPNVQSFVVITEIPKPAAAPEPPSEPAPPADSPINTEPAAPVVPEAPVAPSPAVTLANLPIHEKNAIVAQIENATVEIRKLLGL
jgi:hypothetical protein